MERVGRAIEMLNEVLARKLNSAAGYVLESSPYWTEAERPIFDAIEELNATARRQAQEAARRILLLEGVPQGGAYDPAVADSNYLSVRYLLGQLLARLEQDIAVFEGYRERCEVLEAKDFLTMVIGDDRAHRDQLRALHDRIKAERTGAVTHVP